MVPGALNPLLLAKRIKTPPVWATWDPLNKGTSNDLSNENLTTTHNASNRNNAVRSTIGKSTGKWYWEIKCDYSGPRYFMIGIGSAAESNNGPGMVTDSDGFGYFAVDGGVYVRAAVPRKFSRYYVGSVVGIALDMDAGTCGVYTDGVYQGLAASGLAVPMFAMCNTAGSSTASMTANFGATPFTHLVPEGFNPGLYV